MKRGGIGYVQPGSDTFPSIDEFHKFIDGCNALPCAAWLDGTSPGEQAMPELLELLIDKGVVALNIIPDRNWNIADPEQRRIKVNNLYVIVKLATELSLPLNIGTEMNSYGQRLIDDLNVSELVPVRQFFIDGAFFIYGHTICQRALELGYQSDWAKTYLAERTARNNFYMTIGKRIPPGQVGLSKLKQLNTNMTPTEILAQFEKW